MKIQGQIAIKQRRYYDHTIRKRPQVEISFCPQEWKVKKYVDFVGRWKKETEYGLFLLLFRTDKTLRVSKEEFKEILQRFKDNNFPIHIKHLFVRVVFKEEDGFVYIRKADKGEIVDFYAKRYISRAKMRVAI